MGRRKERKGKEKKEKKKVQAASPILLFVKMETEVICSEVNFLPHK